MTSIEWTDRTWNPLTGCSVVSPGCTNCYAMRLAKRLEAMGMEKYQGLTRTVNGNPVWTGEVRTWPAVLNEPRRWKKPRRVFINSMSDLFHEAVPLSFIEQVLQVVADTPQHQYQLLTKRSERMADVGADLVWPDNLWLGVSVENRDQVFRIEQLGKTRARVKYLSLEPLLGPLDDLPLAGIDWAIVGGESGPSARPIEASWVRAIRDQCVAAGVAFFFKQWGGRTPKAKGRELDGRTWDEYPAYVH